jgi:membrane associated rhomboid family serine protease
MSSGVRRPPILRVLAALIGLNVGIGLLSDVGLTGPYLIGWRAHLGGFALGLVVGWVVRRLGRT